MISITPRRALTWSLENMIVLPLLAGLVFGAVVYDRRDPLEYISGEILPSAPVPGDRVVVRWKTHWYRACEAVVSREIVGSDLVVRPYLKFDLRIPTRMGEQVSDNPFALSETLPHGLTSYRATLRFPNCGVTSWFVPLTVQTGDLFFQVK